MGCVCVGGVDMRICFLLSDDEEGVGDEAIMPRQRPNFGERVHNRRPLPMRRSCVLVLGGKGRQAWTHGKPVALVLSPSQGGSRS